MHCPQILIVILTIIVSIPNFLGYISDSWSESFNLNDCTITNEDGWQQFIILQFPVGLFFFGIGVAIVYPWQLTVLFSILFILINVLFIILMVLCQLISIYRLLLHCHSKASGYYMTVWINFAWFIVLNVILLANTMTQWKKKSHVMLFKPIIVQNKQIQDDEEIRYQFLEQEPSDDDKISTNPFNNHKISTNPFDNEYK